MFIERDAKIILITQSVLGIVLFVSLYLALLFNRQRNSNDNFEILQIMIFCILFIFTIILIASSYSLKKEISNQQDYLKKLQKTNENIKEKIVKIPYNKAGLYSIIIVTVLGIIGLLYLYNVLVLSSPLDITFQKGTLETVSLIIFIIIIILISFLILTLFVLKKRIQTPLYYEYKPCPRCGSSDIYKVEYSAWVGMIAGFINQVRCKKCGKTYNGPTGKDISRQILVYFVIFNVIMVVLIILRSIL